MCILVTSGNVIGLSFSRYTLKWKLMRICYMIAFISLITIATMHYYHMIKLDFMYHTPFLIALFFFANFAMSLIAGQTSRIVFTYIKSHIGLANGLLGFAAASLLLIASCLVNFCIDISVFNLIICYLIAMIMIGILYANTSLLRHTKPSAFTMRHLSIHLVH